MWFKSDVLSTVESAMKERSWRYARVDKDTALTGVVMDGGSALITIHNDENRRTLLVLMHPTRDAVPIMAMIGARLPVLRVHANAGHSDTQVAQVCAALLEQNYQSLLGNLERNASDGEVRLRISVPYRDASITSQQVNWCVDIGVASLAVAVKKIEEIVGGGASAAAPLEEV